jgi:hypothetical protein
MTHRNLSLTEKNTLFSSSFSVVSYLKGRFAYWKERSLLVSSTKSELSEFHAVAILSSIAIYTWFLLG